MTRNIITTLCLLISTTTALVPPSFNALPLFNAALTSGPGGRTSSQDGDRITTQQDDNGPDRWAAKPCQDGECRLTVLQITDVYTLEHLASFKTLLEETRRNAKGSTVVSLLTGDFLSPYLLSSVDGGKGMMRALNRIPLDYLTWGNHEADIKHKTVCSHVKNFKGKWLNSNMLDHEAMDHQQEYEVVELKSPDGSNSRKVGMIAVLSDDPALYSHFKAPGAFGGATIDNPWEALKKYKTLLEGPEHKCDMVIPLQHLYVPDDHKTCQDFDFPVILSGHDHHRVDEVIAGSRLLKPGMNGVYATVLELSWPTPDVKEPKIKARFVKTSEWEADPAMEEENERAYDALLPLRNTQLAKIPEEYFPLTSNGSRESVCTMGKYICTLIKKALNYSRRQRDHKVDAVLLMGGNIRGNADYEDGAFFSMEALEAEVKSDEVVAIVPMPGWLINEGIKATHEGDPIPGWMQYDNGVMQDPETLEVTHVNGVALDKDRIYRVATKVNDLTNGQSWPLTEYYTENKHLLPPKGNYNNIQSELMAYFAKNLWRKLWEALSDETCDLDGCAPAERLKVLDKSGDGIVSVSEIKEALNDLLGYSIDNRENTLAQFVHNYADTSGDGEVTLTDFEIFCDELRDDYDRYDFADLIQAKEPAMEEPKVEENVVQ